MKPLTIIYCGEDGLAAKARAVELRNQGQAVLLANGLMEIEQPEACDHVVIMPDVPGWRHKQIEAAYPGRVQGETAMPRELQLIEIDPALDVHLGSTTLTVATPDKSRGGRPKGSKNKPKVRAA